MTSTSAPSASAPSAEKAAPAVEPVAADEPPQVIPVPADTTGMLPCVFSQKATYTLNSLFRKGVCRLTTWFDCADTAPLEPPQTTHTEREGSTATDAKLADAVNYSIGLNQSSYEDEARKRKARAERFGAPAEEVDVEAQKAADRAKRFGTGGAANGGVGKLDEALPTERGRGKRGRDGESAADDPGLKQGRGKKKIFRRGGGRNDIQGERPAGVQKAVRKAKGVFSSEKDRLAAEARKKKFATA